MTFQQSDHKKGSHVKVQSPAIYLTIVIVWTNRWVMGYIVLSENIHYVFTMQEMVHAIIHTSTIVE